MTAIEKEEFQVNRRKIYNRIIYLLDRHLPHGYQKAILGCFYISRSTVPSIKIFFYIDGAVEYTDFISKVKNSDKITSELSDLCEELYYLMRKVDNKWTTFTFTRERIGRFKAKFGYELLNSVNHMFLLDWRSRYF